MAEKILRSSLREKKRYLLLETDVSRKDIEKAILNYIGTLGYAKSGFQFIRNDIIAVNREMLNEIRGALALTDIKVKRVSGSLKKIKG